MTHCIKYRRLPTPRERREVPGSPGSQPRKPVRHGLSIRLVKSTEARSPLDRVRGRLRALRRALDRVRAARRTRGAVMDGRTFEVQGNRRGLATLLFMGQSTGEIPCGQGALLPGIAQAAAGNGCKRLAGRTLSAALAAFCGHVAQRRQPLPGLHVMIPPSFGNLGHPDSRGNGFCRSALARDALAPTKQRASRASALLQKPFPRESGCLRFPNEGES